MIRYALRCTDGHAFESWFQSADAFDTLRGRSLVECPDCGSTEVSKALMAPRVTTARAKADAPADPAGTPPEAPAPPASPPATSDAPVTMMRPALAAMARLRKKIEESSDWVGRSFAKEARAMHEGTAPERPIWGEATREEAEAMAEEGLPVAPLPFGPRNKSN